MSAHDWNVQIDPIFGCWLWQGKVDSTGYPIVWRGRTPVKAYLLVWTAEIGPIPDGLVADHVCRVRSCVRPLHLELVTQSENLLRRKWSHRARRTHCAKGHSLSTAMVTKGMGRLCRDCHRESEGR
jgi:hypothetical protein